MGRCTRKKPISQLSLEIGAKIKEELKHQNKSIYWLGPKIPVGRNHLYKILRGEASLTLDTLSRIEIVLKRQFIKIV